MKLHENFLIPDTGDDEMQMGPFIDIVFLLLIYFMVTTTLLKTEADLGIRLPGMVQQSKVVKMPDDQVIEITALNAVVLNGTSYTVTADGQIPQLVNTLLRFKQAAQAANPACLPTGPLVPGPAASPGRTSAAPGS